MFDRVSIRAVILGLGVSSVLIASCLAGFGLLGVQQQLDARARVVMLEGAQRNHESSDAFMESIRTDVLRSLQSSIGVNQENSATIRSGLAHHVGELKTLFLERHDLSTEPELRDLNQQIDLALPSFLAASQKAVELALTDPAAGSANFETYRRTYVEFEQKMDRVREILRARVTEVRADTARTAQRGRWMIFASLGGGVLILSLITGLAVRIAQRITTALAASREEATYHALHDNLTGLPNRRLFADRLEHALRQCQREGGSVALLYLDLDRFKQVNDTLGHPVGDGLLRAVADRLRGCIRKSDTVARLGGDEFTIIQPIAGWAGEADELAQRVIHALSQPYRINANDVHVGTSIGFAFAPADADEASHLLSLADLALYRAKAGGRGIACRFTSTLGLVQPAPDRYVPTLAAPAPAPASAAPDGGLALASHG